jgi:hypothetical protein
MNDTIQLQLHYDDDDDDDDECGTVRRMRIGKGN